MSDPFDDIIEEFHADGYNGGAMACPHCAERMSFLMQLDSDLPTTTMSQFLWGSGGVAYVFWCDPCRTSGLFWQCT